MSADVNESCKFQTLVLRATVDYSHVKREEAASNVGVYILASCAILSLPPHYDPQTLPIANI